MSQPIEGYNPENDTRLLCQLTCFEGTEQVGCIVRDSIIDKLHPEIVDSDSKEQTIARMIESMCPTFRGYVQLDNSLTI